MRSSTVALQTRRELPVSSLQADSDERSIRRRVGLTWGLMVLNSVGYVGTAIHIPSAAGKAITQGALPLALLVALSINRRVILRPNVFLCLESLLAFEAIVTSFDPQFLGTIYRTFRLVEFVAVLWLLTPWWGRRDLLLLRCHIISLAVILSSVFLGILVLPTHAIAGGRLGGVLWDIPPTQVAHYAAVMAGLIIVLWLCGQVSGMAAAGIVTVTVVMLVLTHTRTAITGLIAAVIVASMSLLVAKARVRKLLASAGALAAITSLTLSGLITKWLERGEGAQQLTSLTGRTPVWAALVSFPRDKFQEIFGFGLSNGSFNGLSIDSNWLASYQEQGLFGVAICALMLIFLFATACFQPRGVQRALALFLVTYCLVASVTEVGFTDATPYLLELTLAASMLVPQQSMSAA